MAEDEIHALLVEDNPGDARLLQELISELRSIRIRLRHASRLKEALEILGQAPVDVVLLDLSLPDAHGVDTVAQTNAAAANIAIVVLTGLDDETTAIRAMHEGAQDYLVKGQVDSNLLGRAIRYAMERKRADENARRLIREQAARAQAEAAERRSRFLSEAGRSFASSLDFDATLSCLAKLVVPEVADCCLIDMLEENGELRRLAAACRGGTSIDLTRERPRRVSDNPDDPVAQVLRTAEQLVLPELPEATRQALAFPELWPRQPCSALAVPLIARGRTLGVLTLLSTSPTRTFQQDDFTLAEGLASRAALALDNARLYRAREEILEVVSHDLRTPLTVVSGSLDVLRMDGRAPPAPLDALHRATQHMNWLIENLLDMIRLDVGVFSLDRRPLDVGALIDDVTKMLRLVVEHKSLRLRTNRASDLPYIDADRQRVLQVLWNLVGNAIKFTPARGTITLGVTAEPGEVRFSVADTGPGIPEKNLAQLFDRFWQSRKDDGYQGLGLGLSIAKAIVEAHGGRIWVSSAPSAGTTFFFTLPLARTPSPAPPAS